VENERPRAAVSPVGGQAPLARRRRVLAQRPEPAELEPDHPDQLPTTVIIFEASRHGKGAMGSLFGALSLAGTATYSGGRPVETAALELAELEELEQQESALGCTAAEPDTEVNEQRADDSVCDDPQALQHTESRVGSRGPVLPVNTL
jgi:hypothetical protein